MPNQKMINYEIGRRREILWIDGILELVLATLAPCHLPLEMPVAN